MPIRKRKVFAYITHGRRLLVFTHPESPEAGIQVPAGSVKDGEALPDAALREAREETGLTALTLVRYLGAQDCDIRAFGRDEISERHFYHLRCEVEPPAAWRHGEFDPSEGSAAFIPFDFFWLPLDEEMPALIAAHDALLPQLRRSLSSAA